MGSTSQPTASALSGGSRPQHLSGSLGRGHEKGGGNQRPPPHPTYSAPGALPQDPCRAAESPAPGHTLRTGADHVTPLTTSAFDLPDHLAAKADPAMIAAGRGALRGDRGEPRADDRRPVRPPRRRAQGARRRRAGGDGPRPGDPPADRPAARRCDGSAWTCVWVGWSADDDEAVYIGRLGLTDRTGRRLLVDWRSPAAEPFFGATHAHPMGLASRRRYRWTRGRVSDYWDEVFTPDGLERQRGPRRPVGLHRQPGRQQVGPDARRARAPSRPTRTPSSVRAHAAPWSSTAVRVPGRRSSRCTVRRTCSTPTRASARVAEACSSSGRTSPTSPTSPTCCPASARRACRPAPCATSFPRGPRPPTSPTRRSPGSRRPPTW